MGLGGGLRKNPIFVNELRPNNNVIKPAAKVNPVWWG